MEQQASASQENTPMGQFGVLAEPEGADAAFSPAPRVPKGHPVVAWFFIAVFCLTAILIHVLDLKESKPKAGPVDDPLGTMLMELQAKYMVGAADLEGASPLIYGAAEKALNKGTIGQRQRFVILAGELVDKKEAAAKLKELDELIEKEQQGAGDKSQIMTQEQESVQRLLHELYPLPVVENVATVPAEGNDVVAAPVETNIPTMVLSKADGDLFEKELGWFGKLALHPSGDADKDARDEVLGPARVLLTGAIAGAVIAVIAGGLGFAGLITMVALLCLRKLRSGVRDFTVHHGIYAETFAIWMLLLLGLQVVAGFLGNVWPQLAMPILFVAFFMSLIALLWPVLRGVSWKQVRLDIGWHGGGTPWLQPLFGPLGYLMGLPILAAGVAITYVLLMIQQATAGAGGAFDPTSGPAHPIIQQLGGTDWTPKIMVLLLGAVAAPIVEETMFRGVLYRHLRGATIGVGLAGSIILGAVINSFVFAIIHPQGWVAVPALMSLAIAFTLMREWRGSILPSMMMHGISNFIVLTALILALSV